MAISIIRFQKPRKVRLLVWVHLQLVRGRLHCDKPTASCKTSYHSNQWYSQSPLKLRTCYKQLQLQKSPVNMRHSAKLPKSFMQNKRWIAELLFNTLWFSWYCFILDSFNIFGSNLVFIIPALRSGSQFTIQVISIWKWLGFKKNYEQQFVVSIKHIIL